MNARIRVEATNRNISRLCHFTSSRTLIHMACDETSLLSTALLEDDENSLFYPTDLNRFDGYKDHVCCSVQYPNCWYFDKRRASELLFQSWVVLLIKPDYLWADDTLFCARNAAANSGRAVTGGEQGFAGMFAPSVIGAYNKPIIRSSTHLHSCPTDNQAEVLVPNRISRDDIMAVGVCSPKQAKELRIAIDLAGKPNTELKFIIAPEFYNKYKLSQHITSGRAPLEVLWSED